MSGSARRGGAAWDGVGFWDFSLAVYAREAVRETCLSLQESIGADVNLVLFCCWVGATGRGALDRDDLARLSRTVSAWQDDVVAPLRALRVRLKTPSAGIAAEAAERLRQAVKAAELEAERIEQDALARALDRPPAQREGEARAQDIARSLDAYFAELQVQDPGLTAMARVTLTAECGRP